MSEHTENIITMWLGLAVPISYCSLPEEIESDSQYQLSLDLFGSLNKAIGAGFAKLGYFPTIFRYQVIDLRKNMDYVAPQSIVFTCYTPDGQSIKIVKSSVIDEPKVYAGVSEMAAQLSKFTEKKGEVEIDFSDLSPMCFVVSSKALVSIDTVVDAAEKLFHASKDSLHYYQTIKKYINMPIRDFLEKGINLESFPLYLDYKIRGQSSAPADKIFDMKVEPARLTLKRTKYDRDSHREETLFKKDYSTNYLHEQVPNYVIEYLEELDSVTKEGAMKAGKMLGRDYQDLLTKLDICVFKTSKGCEKGYVVHIGVHEPHGQIMDSVKFTSIANPRADFTPSAYKVMLIKILERIRDLADERVFPEFENLLKKYQLGVFK